MTTTHHTNPTSRIEGERQYQALLFARLNRGELTTEQYDNLRRTSQARLHAALKAARR